MMAAPLVVSNEVLGAVAFLHDSDPGYFNEDLAAKGTILAGQLGSLMEARRLTEFREKIIAGRNSGRRGQHAAWQSDVNAVIEALADRIRILLRTRLVCVFMRQEGPFELRGVAADNPHLAKTAGPATTAQRFRFAADLAARAVGRFGTGDGLDRFEFHALGRHGALGMLLAAPFRSSAHAGRDSGVSQQDGIFTVDERSLVAAIAGFGAVALANAETLFDGARAGT
jgi:hypothetical protein